MQGTALVYSAHDRCEDLHNHFIVQRALRGRENRRIFFLPMSEHALHAQEPSWGGQLLHYWTQSPSGFSSIEEILRSH